MFFLMTKKDSVCTSTLCQGRHIKDPVVKGLSGAWVELAGSWADSSKEEMPEKSSMGPPVCELTWPSCRGHTTLERGRKKSEEVWQGLLPYKVVSFPVLRDSCQLFSLIKEGSSRKDQRLMEHAFTPREREHWEIL